MMQNMHRIKIYDHVDDLLNKLFAHVHVSTASCHDIIRITHAKWHVIFPRCVKRYARMMF